ncbi:hypothetical protein ABT126_29240 [Streptomyces sp. NPDC002012]|uniref:hypothetical protein n=1 Tax=Streptomyces sp. NPDC002012 TaxID=3154532 RepID=UPI00332376B5
MYERRNTPGRPPPPVGAIAASRPPGEIRVGDYMFLNNAYRRIADMRSDGTSRRTLIFADHLPLSVGQSTVTYRPLTLP